MTLTKVAKALGISSSLLHDWHSGSRLPSGKNLGQLLKLADYLNLSLDALLFDRTETEIFSTNFHYDGRLFRVYVKELATRELASNI